MKLKSYAKINLCLKVNKDSIKRGKHSIDSIFYLYKKLYDEIIIKPSNSTSITYVINGKQTKIDDCLIAKTLRYLQIKYSWNVDYDITVIKHIPLRSGLGGGSSNAATVINYLISKNKPTALDLKDIALTLGSDIPFFLTKYEVARVKRHGEYVSPLAYLTQKFEIIDTHIECSTAQVFNLLDQDVNYQSQVDVDNIFNMLINKQHLNVVYNDLTKYIIESNNSLQDWLNKNPGSWFSGSGGTLIKIKE